MTKQEFPPATYVSTNAGLHHLVETLVHEPLLAVDTESNSLYAYQEQVCLIQLSTRSQDYIIDPLTITDIQPLGRLLADPNIEKVFHAAEYDLICLKRDFDFTANNVFDTMIAARICGHKSIGLGTLLAEYFDIKLDKSHQRDDWGKRPLDSDSLRYAQRDTHYLARLRDVLYDKLVALGRWDEAQEIFGEYSAVLPVNGHHFDPDGFWGISIPNRLNLYETGIVKALYLLRDEMARQRDQPPFKIFGNKVMVTLAQTDPDTLDELQQVRGISSWVMRHHSQRILKAIKTGRQYRLSPPTNPPAPDPRTVELYTLLHSWRKTRAHQRGVESDVIISKQTLWKLAELLPASLADMTDVPGLGPWRLGTYGAEILDVIQAYTSNGRS